MNRRLFSAAVGVMTAVAMVMFGGAATGVAVASSSPQLSPSAVAAFKASNDADAAYIQQVAAEYAQHNAQKRAEYQGGLLRPAVLAGSPAAKVAMYDTASGSAAGSAARTAPLNGAVWGCNYYCRWLSPLVQYGEPIEYWCGPTDVSMIAWTVPGPSNVGISTAAAWMGTNTSGTSVGQETAGLNHFVGQHDYGYNFYGFVFMSGNPTSSQRSAFLGDLELDIDLNSPVAGDAWEVPGGPHLTGHPVNLQIFHWFEIGGWNTKNGTVYYADPAAYDDSDIGWKGVPERTWYNTYNLETILGGRGYAF